MTRSSELMRWKSSRSRSSQLRRIRRSVRIGFIAANSSLAIALQIEQGGQVAMVDADLAPAPPPPAWHAARRRCRRGGSCRDRWRRRRPRWHRPASGRGAREISSSASALAARPRIGSATTPVKWPSCSIRRLARFSWKPSMAAMRVVKTSKPPETSAVQAPLARMVCDQRAAAGGQRQPIGDDAVDDGGVEALQQRDALAQGRLEGDLAVHRARGDGGDMILDADLVGQFVDAFLVDHGRIHVGDAGFSCGALRPAGRRRRPARRPARRAGAAVDLGGIGRLRQGKIAGNAFGQPANSACADRPRGHIRKRRRQSAVGGTGNQRGDERHGKFRHGSGRRPREERDPDSRADRQRQVGAGARSGRAHGRRHRQHRFHAGLFGARRADGAAERRRPGPRAAFSLRPRPSRRPPIRPAPGCAM